MNYTKALTMEAIQTLAPSAFAGQAYEKQSSRYSFIPTSDVITRMQDSGFVPVMASQSRTRIAGKEFFTKHMIRFRDQNALTQAAVVGDSILEAVLINSHDGSSAYKLMLGIFRFVCSNGMFVADSTFESIHVRHTGNILDQVVDGSKRLFAEGAKVLDVVGKWQGIDLVQPEQLALATAAHQVRFGAESPIAPASLLTSRRYDDNGTDLWRTFNRIQENATKGYRTGQKDANGRRIGVREVKSIDGSTNLNQALWTLASKMAELKAA